MEKTLLFSFVIVFCISSLFAGCEAFDDLLGNTEEDAKEDLLIGNWTLLRKKADGVNQSGFSGTLAIRSDGTGTHTEKVVIANVGTFEETTNFTWSLDSDELTFNYEGTDSSTPFTSFTVAEGLLVLSYNNGSQSVEDTYTK